MDVLQEIVRARLPIRPDVLRRWQQEIQKMLTAPATPPDPLRLVKKERASTEAAQ